MINKKSHCFVSGDFLWHERKCAISYGKHGSIIVVKWNSGPYKLVTESIPIISQGWTIIPRDTRKRTLLDWFWIAVNITIGGKSFAIQQYANVLSRIVSRSCQTAFPIWWPIIIWYSVSNKIHRSWERRGITNRSWWVYNPSEDLFTPWTFQRAFMYQRIKCTMIFFVIGLVRKSLSTETLSIESNSDDVSLLW